MSPTTVIDPDSERRATIAAAWARGPGPRRPRCGRRCGGRRRGRTRPAARGRRGPRSTRASSIRARSATVQGISASDAAPGPRREVLLGGGEHALGRQGQQGRRPEEVVEQLLGAQPGPHAVEGLGQLGEAPHLAGELPQVEARLLGPAVLLRFVGPLRVPFPWRIRSSRPAWPLPVPPIDGRSRPVSSDAAPGSKSAVVPGTHDSGDRGSPDDRSPGAGATDEGSRAPDDAASQASAASGAASTAAEDSVPPRRRSWPAGTRRPAGARRAARRSGGGRCGCPVGGGPGDDAGRGLGGEAQDGGAEGHLGVAAQGPLAAAHRPGHHDGHAGLALQAGHRRGRPRPVDLDAVDQARDGGQGDPALAQGRQDVLDVAQEEGVRAR